MNAVTFEPFENAWIGLYGTNETNDRNWVLYQRVATHTGKFLFKFPKVPGNYEARLYANGTYTVLIRSAPFAIAALI